MAGDGPGGEIWIVVTRGLADESGLPLRMRRLSERRGRGVFMMPFITHELSEMPQYQRSLASESATPASDVDFDPQPFTHVRVHRQRSRH